MLFHLFSSRTRVKLLSLFLLHPSSEYYVRELTRITNEQINSIRRELVNLENVELLFSKKVNNRKYYTVNTDCIIFEELQAIFAKMSDDRYEIIKGITEHGNIEVLAMHGTLKQPSYHDCDIIVVGEISNRLEFESFIAKLEAEYDREIRYVLFTPKEFNMRHNYNDRFLTTFFSSQPTLLIDKIRHSW
jgi:hypothetical protein